MPRRLLVDVRLIASVHLYRFDLGSTAMGGILGACHSVEIPFVFDNLDRGARIAGSSCNAAAPYSTAGTRSNGDAAAGDGWPAGPPDD